VKRRKLSDDFPWYRKLWWWYLKKEAWVLWLLGRGENTRHERAIKTEHFAQYMEKRNWRL
jgi:hypothetical protein